MPVAGGGFEQCYNVQAVVAADSLLVVADAESATLFKPLFDDAIVKHNVTPGQLTLHADRGSPMKAKATVFLLADLG
jgi:hypothetical protein